MAEFCWDAGEDGRLGCGRRGRLCMGLGGGIPLRGGISLPPGKGMGTEARFPPHIKI